MQAPSNSNEQPLGPGSSPGDRARRKARRRVMMDALRLQRETYLGHGEPSPEQERHMVFLGHPNQCQAWEHNARQLGLWWEQGRLRGPDGPIEPTVVHPSYGPSPTRAGVPATGVDETIPSMSAPGTRFSLGGSSASSGTWIPPAPSPEADRHAASIRSQVFAADVVGPAAPVTPSPSQVRRGLEEAERQRPGEPAAVAATPRSASPQRRLRQRRVETLVPDPNQHVVVTRHGACYHAPFCGYLSTAICIEVTLHEALQVRNLRPCGSCDVDSFVRQQMIRNPHE